MVRWQADHQGISRAGLPGSENSTDTAWGDNFIQIRGSWYGKREEIHTRCNTCEAHTDQIIYQNEKDETYIYLCSCWTDTNMERDPRAVIRLRT